MNSSVPLNTNPHKHTLFSALINPLSRNSEMKRGKGKQALDTWAVGGSKQQLDGMLGLSLVSSSL